MVNTEQDLRLDILNTLLTTPHRDFAALHPLHRDMAAKDPRFYVRLAAWYNDHGEVRDHKEMFVAHLALSDFPGHRDVGLALLRQLPPYQVGRVLDFIHGRKTNRKVAPKGGARKAAADVAGKTVTLVITVVAARTLVADAFGVMALAMATGWLLGVATDAGLSMHLARESARRSGRAESP